MSGLWLGQRMQMDKMSETQVTDALKVAPEWSLVGEAIQRTYQFKDFITAMKFVNAVAEAAEAAQHHPDILIRYSRVTLTLATHDASGITSKDFDLASHADAFFARFATPESKPVAKAARVEKRKH
jgi:4a-hydroxytetrahydrobiopterin dehydratase